MGKDDEIFDIEQEIYDSFEKEQMLAYYDFTVPTGNLPGLCKISKPKEGKTTYFSALFIIDTTDASSFNALSSYVRNINWDKFRDFLPGFNSVMSMPNAAPNTENYLLEADVFIDTPIYVPKQFVLHKFYPAIEKVTGFKAGALVFWDDIASIRQDIGKDVNKDTAEASLSLFQKIKGALNLK